VRSAVEPIGERQASSRILVGLLNWFARNARDLPWRRTRDAYAIWVSEIMLQQTQVKTVIPFWERWMKRLPTIGSLARARSQTIHKLWEGLGYYTRVRNMQKAARVIVREHGQRFPNEYEKVLALPGIGRYTAGAICSIAFNQPTPILDGNVIRVLTRLFGISGDPKEKQINELLWQKAEALVQAAERGAVRIPGTESRIGPMNFPRSRRRTRSRRSMGRGNGASNWTVRTESAGSCSMLNQSLMELGALICTPKQPKCDCCPVRSFCVAARDGLTDALPQLKPRPSVTRRRFVAFVFSDREKFLVRQRPPDVVNGHLWEFPNVERTRANGNSHRAHCRTLGGDPASLRPLCRVEHSITRYRISLTAYRAMAGKAAETLAGGQWLELAELERLPFTSAHKRILNAVRQHRHYASR
jgi:A/G-specific adenine glycosylase